MKQPDIYHDMAVYFKWVIVVLGMTAMTSCIYRNDRDRYELEKLKEKTRQMKIRQEMEKNLSINGRFKALKK